MPPAAALGTHSTLSEHVGSSKQHRSHRKMHFIKNWLQDAEADSAAPHSPGHDAAALDAPAPPEEAPAPPPLPSPAPTMGSPAATTAAVLSAITSSPGAAAAGDAAAAERAAAAAPQQPSAPHTAAPAPAPATTAAHQSASGAPETLAAGAPAAGPSQQACPTKAATAGAHAASQPQAPASPRSGLHLGPHLQQQQQALLSKVQQRHGSVGGASAPSPSASSPHVGEPQPLQRAPSERRRVQIAVPQPTTAVAATVAAAPYSGARSGGLQPPAAAGGMPSGVLERNNSHSLAAGRATGTSAGGGTDTDLSAAGRWHSRPESEALENYLASAVTTMTVTSQVEGPDIPKRVAIPSACSAVIAAPSPASRCAHTRARL